MNDSARKEMIKALSKPDLNQGVMNTIQREALIRECAIVRANIHRPLDERGTQSQKEVGIHMMESILIKPPPEEHNPMKGTFEEE